MKYFLPLLLLLGFATPVLAEDAATTSTTTEQATTSSSTASTTPQSDPLITVIGSLAGGKKDITQPEEASEKDEILEKLSVRNTETLTPFNFFAFWVERAIELGIPANTIVLILLIPIFAMLVAFVRVVLGFQTLELLVPIILAYAFVAVGIVAGAVILTAVVVASYVSKILLQKVSMMFFPKRALSMCFLALFVLAALITTAALGFGNIQTLSIFPIIILTLLGDSIVSLQLYKSFSETASITLVTFALALLGYVFATSSVFFNLILVYPEIILLTIPANILIGRYFGLRLTEYFRFNQID